MHVFKQAPRGSVQSKRSVLSGPQGAGWGSAVHGRRGAYDVIVALTVAYKYREARSLPKNTGINLNTA